MPRARKTTTPREDQYAGDLVSNAGKREMGPKCGRVGRYACDCCSLYSFSLFPGPTLNRCLYLMDSRSFSTVNGAEDDDDNEDAVPVVFPCPVCRKSCSSDNTRWQHVNLEHISMRIFPTAASLKEHVGRILYVATM